MYSVERLDFGLVHGSDKLRRAIIGMTLEIDLTFTNTVVTGIFSDGSIDNLISEQRHSTYGTIFDRFQRPRIFIEDPLYYLSVAAMEVDKMGVLFYDREALVQKWDDYTSPWRATDGGTINQHLRRAIVLN